MTSDSSSISSYVYMGNSSCPNSLITVREVNYQGQKFYMVDNIQGVSKKSTFKDF